MRAVGFEVENHFSKWSQGLLSNEAALLPLLLQKEPIVAHTRSINDQGTQEIPNNFTLDSVLIFHLEACFPFLSPC